MTLPDIPNSAPQKREAKPQEKFPAVKLWYVSQTPVVLDQRGEPEEIVTPVTVSTAEPAHTQVVMQQEAYNEPEPVKAVTQAQAEEPALQPVTQGAQSSAVLTPSDEFKESEPAKTDVQVRKIIQPASPQNQVALKTPVLKKIDINRIGASAYYEDFQGLRLAKYFTVAQRVEIFEEPKPIDSYILDAKKVRFVNQNQPWDKASQLRSQIVPIFTRAYGTEVTISDPNDKEGQIRYTHDYREIYGNQFPIYMQDNARNVNYKHEEWDQNEILIMHSKKIPGIDWNYTSNFGYRYSTMDAKNDGSTFSYYENRHTYFTFFSLAPSDTLELFGQMEYFKSKRPDASFIYQPDHYFWASELRIRSKDFKTSFIPRFSYSGDYYLPTYNRFRKHEAQFRVGHDFSEKFKASSTLKAVSSVREDVDNTAPLYVAPNPINDKAIWAGIENRAQYNIYDKLWLQGGLDYNVGANMSDFDNYGLLAGLEYYAPGMIRIDFGWRGNHYYNIQDFLSTIYFKFYLFM